MAIRTSMFLLLIESFKECGVRACSRLCVVDEHLQRINTDRCRPSKSVEDFLLLLNGCRMSASKLARHGLQIHS